MAHGRTLTIFWQDGTPDGVITVNLSSWNGCCVKIPRDCVQKCDFEELTMPGVYFLVDRVIKLV